MENSSMINIKILDFQFYQHLFSCLCCFSSIEIVTNDRRAPPIFKQKALSLPKMTKPEKKKTADEKTDPTSMFDFNDEENDATTNGTTIRLRSFLPTNDPNTSTKKESQLPINSNNQIFRLLYSSMVIIS